MLFVLLLPFTSLAQDDKYIAVFKNGKWGVIDSGMKTIIPYQYHELEILNKKFFRIKKDGFYGLLDENLNQVLVNVYQAITPANENSFIIKTGGKYGIADENGKKLLDCKYHKISVPNKDIAIVESSNIKSFYHFGAKVLSESFVNLQATKSDLIILDKGDEKVLFDYNKDAYSKPFTSIKEKNKNLFFCVEADLKKYVLYYGDKFEIEPTDYFFYKKLKQDRQAYRINGILKIADEKNQTISKVEADNIYEEKQKSYTRTIGDLFTVDYYKIENNYKVGILSPDFKLLIKAEYDNVVSKDTAFEVVKDRKRGLLDLEGNIIVPPKYDWFNRLGEYWMVSIGSNQGVAQTGGKELIKPQYYGIQQVFNDKFIVLKDSKYGLVDKDNRVLLKIEYQSISEANDRLILVKDSLFGLANKNGTVLVRPKYQNITVLNDEYFQYNEGGKAGVLNKSGNVVIQANFHSLMPTGSNRVFYYKSFEFEHYTLADLKRKFELDINVSIRETKRPYYKTGIINVYGQKLLDAKYYEPQITFDFEGNTVIVKEKSAVLIITFEDNGQFVDKTRYKNYIFVKPHYSSGRRNYWLKGGRKHKYLYGLFMPSGRQLIDYRFKEVNQKFLNHPDLVMPYGSNRRWGIVNERTGRTVLPEVYKRIYTEDVSSASVVRCVKSNGRAIVIDTNARVLKKGLVYIDDFSRGFARAARGGRASYSDNYSHKVETKFFKTIYPARKEGQGGNYRVCNESKWGVLDTEGKWSIKPKYNFIQSIAHGTFIADKKGLWGVLNTKGDIVVDFIYNEIRNFYDDSTNYWADIPYYKVKKGAKWGVINDKGQEVIPIEYDDIKHFEQKKKLYFKSVIDNKEVLFGLVNEKGQLVLQPKYPFIGSFNDDCARIKINRRKWLFINKNMNIFPERPFLDVKDFKEGLAAVRSGKGWGFIDANGDMQIPCSYIDVGSFNEGMAKAKIYYPKKFFGLIKSKRVYGIIDKQGKLVYNTNSSYCSDVNKGQIVSKKGKKYIVTDIKGKKVLPGSYTEIVENPDYGLYAVRNNMRQYALYNKNGEQIVDFGKYKSYGRFSEGLCYVEKKIGSAFIDLNGAERFSIKCKDARGFKGGLAAIKFENGWGFVDTLGNTIIEGQYFHVWDFILGKAKVKDRDYQIYYIDRNGQKVSEITLAGNDKYQVIKKGDFKGIADSKGTWLVYPAANDIGLFKQGLAPVGIRRMYGLYSADGKEILKPKNMIVEPDKSGLVKVINLEELRYVQ